MFTDSNGVNDPPFIVITEPSGDLFTAGPMVTLRWDDADPNGNAVISLFHDNDSTGGNGTLIKSGISEDPDGEEDTLAWDIGSLSEGGYYIYAVIDDGNASVTRYGDGHVRVDRTPPTVSASPGGGAYDSGQMIAIEADETAQIYYTRDGSEPGTDSILYGQPIEVGESIILKFMAEDTAGNRSDTLTEEYTIVPVNNVEGDLDNDGDVDCHDRSIIRNAMFTCSGTKGFVSEADYSGDGCISIADYIIWHRYLVKYLVKNNIPYLKGDLDYDGDVDMADCGILMEALWTCSRDGSFVPEADFNGDGFITLRDAVRWRIYRKAYKCSQ